MSVINASAGSRRVQVETLSPVAQATVDAYAALVGSEIDVRPWTSLSYTIKNITNTICWKVQGANISDYSDVVDVQAERDVLASGIDYYAVAQAPYAFYRVVIKAKVGSSQGTVTLNGLAKG